MMREWLLRNRPDLEARHEGPDDLLNTLLLVEAIDAGPRLMEREDPEDVQARRHRLKREVESFPTIEAYHDHVLERWRADVAKVLAQGETEKAESET